MANPQIKLKRSSTQNKRPTPANVPLGELAINTYDGYLYASKDVGAGTTVITVNPWRVGTGTDSYNIDFTAGNVGINSASPTALLDVNGDVNISGVVTATSFTGDGSNITGISTLNITNYGVGLGGGISNVVEDTTPQLGGDLDINGNDITGNGNINLSGFLTAFSFVKEANSGGFLKADGTEDTNTYLTSYTETQTLDDVLGLGNISGIGLSVGVVTATSFVKSGGTSSQFLKADGSVDSSTYLTSFTETDPVVAAINGIVKSDGTTISAATAGTDYLTDISQDTNPQLGGNLDLNSNDITGTGNLNITGIATFSGNVTIGGTLTYDDVTNIDSIGLVTARSGIEFGVSGVGGTISSTGNVTFAGIVTASSFVKSGGTSSEFLKADGSVDSSTYLTSFTETNDLSSAVTWANVPDANITESSVTQHQAALSITESQISDLQSYLTSYTETQTLDDVLGLGNTSSTGLSVGVVTATSFDGNLTGNVNSTGVSTFTSNVSIGTTIEIIPYDDLGALSFEGSAGQLFSITNNLTSGSIFSVNDISGLPSIDVDADGTIQLAPNSSTEYVGIGTTAPTVKLDVNGDVNISGAVTATSFTGDGSNLTGIVTGIQAGSNITILESPAGNFIVTSTASGGGDTGTATTITLADESTDTECFLIFATDATGDQEPKTGSNLTFNSSTGALTATSFVKESNSSGFLKADGTEDTNTYLTSYTETQTLDDVLGLGNTSSTGLSVGVATATSFVKDGGTSSQFLKADGSVDSSTYLTSYTETNDLSSAVTWANVPDANITESSVTQHQAALSITESQISDLQSYLTSYTETQTLDDVLGLGNTSDTGISVGIVTATSFVKSSNSGGFLKADGTEDTNTYLTSYTETNDLSSAVTWTNVPDANITESSVTQHQAALSITESQISDLQSYLTSYTETQTLDDVLGLGNVSGIGLSVGVVTATSFSGDGSNLTGIVTGIQAGDNITILESPAGNFIVTSTASGGSAGAATTITLADESTDTICYPIFATDATGDQELKTDASNLLYNSNTGALTAGSFFGDGSTLTNVLSNVSEDTTPQLGGPLDINSNNITGTGNIDITGSLDVSGIASVGSAITMYGSTGIVSATEYYGDGSNLSSIVTQLTAGTGIVLNQTTGNVTITASGGGDADPTTRTTTRFVATASQSSFTVSYNVGYVDAFLNGSKLDSTEYTATNGTSVSLTTAAAADDIVEIVAYESVGIVSITSATQGLDVTGHLETDTFNSSGIVTAASGIDAIGIQSGGVNIADGVITALNFIGAGNTFALNGTVVDISIAGGGGGISNVVEDTTPQLGGDLDLNDQDITGTGNLNITGVVTATSFSGSGSSLTGIVTGIQAGTNITVLESPTGNFIVTSTASGSSGIEIENSGTSVGTAITAINFNTNLTATASGGIATITASGGSGTQTLDDVLGLGNTSDTGISVGVVTATSFVKLSNSGGFLKADGTEDTNTYLTSYTETQTLDDVLGLGNISGIGLSVGVVTATSFDGNLTGFDELTAPHSSTTKNYAVTVASKSDHRYQGTGSGNAYYIDGVESPILHLTPGRTYRFTLSSGDMSSHPFRFYLEADKTTQYTTDVTTTSTYAEITITDSTPAVIHYQCSVHEYMGNAIITHSNAVNTPYLITGLNGANITGVVTATSLVKSGGTSSQFLKADGSVDSSTYLTSYTETDPVVAAINGIVKSNGSTISAASAGTDYLAPTGDGSGLSGIVTNIQAGANITVLESPTGNFIVTSTAAGGDTVTINATATDILSVSSGDISADDAGADKLVFWDDSESKLTYLTAGSGLSISGTTITATGGGGSSGIEIENSGTSVGTAITSINFSTNLTATASGGIATITASGGGAGGNPVSKSSTETTATGGQTVFNGTYTVGFVDVFLNGSKLDSSEFTATNGTSITLTTGATANDIIEVIGFTFADGSTNIELSNDGSPELGGNLDLKGFNIVDSVGGGIINATVAGQIDALEIMLFT